jgi:hypothetical protein
LSIRGEVKTSVTSTTSLAKLYTVLVGVTLTDFCGIYTFNLDGKPWTAVTSAMITNVDYVMQGNTVVIRKVEFAVPVDGTNPYGMSYLKSCEVNKAIRTGEVQ